MISKVGLPTRTCQNLLRSLAPSKKASFTDIKALIRSHIVPRTLRWLPTLCIRDGARSILIHALASPMVPPYLTKAARELRKRRGKVTIVILARQVAAETDEDAQPVIMSAAQVAEKVARECLTIGAGLAIERSREVYPIFPSNFELKGQCSSKIETGHIPTWLYRDMGDNESFSPHLRRTFRRFSNRYGRATKGKSIAYDTECDLLREFARAFTRGDRRIFFPIGHLDILREYEQSGANRKARDHFFHTFNNLFLGFRILSGLTHGRRHIADIDRIVASPATPRLYPWEILWFLTCVFHDPAYIAEDPWATFRFAYSAEQDLTTPDSAIPKRVATEIRNLWDTVFARARSDLTDLYYRVVRPWLPPSIRTNDRHYFDESLKKAYFNGRYASHSVLSALKLIHSCNSSRVPRHRAFDPDVALSCCVIAGLSILFHDQRCREVLQKAHIGPIAFENLPYATLLMFVDCLQDDRRDITTSRFRKHGVLAGAEASQKGDKVQAAVCLREAPFEGWAKRIAEYESVLRWVNAKSETVFAINYRALINSK